MAGAAVLAARAAYRAGVGMVTMAVVKDIYAAVLNAVPNAIIIPLKSAGFVSAADINLIKKYINQNPQDAMLLGCGLGKGGKNALKLLSLKIPCVLDADALNFLAKDLNVLDKNTPYILTPHYGEMQRLLSKKEVDGGAKELGLKTHAVVLLKGPQTKVFYDGQYYQNTTGNEGLAKAGSGDTLAGIIAAILAQKIKDGGKTPVKQKAFEAALCGVYLHGLCADIAAAKYTKAALMPDDVDEALPQALKTIFNKKI